MKLNALWASSLSTVGLLVGGMQAQVPSLGFVETDVYIAPGGSFSVNLNVLIPSGADPVTGVNYWLATDAAGSGHFRLTDRDLTGSLFQEVVKSTAYLTDPVRAFLSYENNLTVNPDPNRRYRNGDALDADLGGLTIEDPVSGLSTELGPGTYLVARLTVTSQPGTPVGSYPLETTVTHTDIGWVDGAPLYEEAPFSSHAALTIHVVPEPSDLALTSVLGLLGFAAYRGGIRFMRSRG